MGAFVGLEPVSRTPGPSTANSSPPAWRPWVGRQSSFCIDRASFCIDRGVTVADGDMRTILLTCHGRSWLVEEGRRRRGEATESLLLAGSHSSFQRPQRGSELKWTM